MLTWHEIVGYSTPDDVATAKETYTYFNLKKKTPLRFSRHQNRNAEIQSHSLSPNFLSPPPISPRRPSRSHPLTRRP